MKSIRIGTLSIFVAVLPALSFAMGDVSTKTYSWCYKMTVSIDTPEGVKTGTAVRQVSVQIIPQTFYKEHPYRVHVNPVLGDAVLVDLGKRGKLFALKGNQFSPDYAYRVVFSAFPFPGPLTEQGVLHYSQLKHAKTILTTENYPEMVTFSNFSDPTTIEPVWNGEFYDAPHGRGRIRTFRIKTDDFERLFGKGVRIHEISIEMTSEPVTQKINEHLPSFSNQRFWTWFKTLRYGDDRRITPDNF